MRIQIEVGADDDLVRDLYQWLREDPDVRRYVKLELTAASQPVGAMGAVEIINMVMGQGFTALNLALSYAAWKSARPTAPPVTVHVSGGSFTLNDASEETMRHLVQALQSAEAAGDTTQAEPGPHGAGASGAE
ncbi:effector-associated constant component EACC1 [Streptomyces sp. NPDC001937]